MGVAPTFEVLCHRRHIQQNHTKKKQVVTVRSAAKDDAKKALSGTCVYHLGQQLNVTGFKGKKIECRNKGYCRKTHENIENMTREEVCAVIENVPENKLKKSFEARSIRNHDFLALMMVKVIYRTII